MPSTAAEWINIAEDFERLYNFSRCIGCLDGKHLQITKPEAGPFYYNYKGYYSIVLMALVNAKKEFLMIDIGTNGKVSDGGVLFYTKFWELYEQQKLNLPEPCELPNNTTKFPYVFLGDEAFALDTNFMKPYPQKSCTDSEKIFNHRLSSARQVVECAFGLLATKFRIFHTPIYLEPEKATIVATACCYLHNFLLIRKDRNYTSSKDDKDTIDGLGPTKNKNAKSDAKGIRDKFRQYFYNENKSS